MSGATLSYRSEFSRGRDERHEGRRGAVSVAFVQLLVLCAVSSHLVFSRDFSLVITFMWHTTALTNGPRVEANIYAKPTNVQQVALSSSHSHVYLYVWYAWLREIRAPEHTP